MKSRTAPALATIALALSGIAATPAHAQQTQDDVAQCVRGDWESTGFTVEHSAMDDFEVGGGGGVALMIEEDGAATVDFAGMDRIGFSGEAHNVTVRGAVELSGEATGTVSTTEDDSNSGTIDAADISSEDVELTVELTDPFASRPVDGVPVDELRQLAQMKGDEGTHTPVLSEATYECADATLTVNRTVQDQQREHEATLTWTFERTG